MSLPPLTNVSKRRETRGPTSAKSASSKAAGKSRSTSDPDSATTKLPWTPWTSRNIRRCSTIVPTGAPSEPEELTKRVRVHRGAGLERDNVSVVLEHDEASALLESAFHAREALEPELIADELR